MRRPHTEWGARCSGTLAISTFGVRSRLHETASAAEVNGDAPQEPLEVDRVRAPNSPSTRRPQTRGTRCPYLELFGPGVVLDRHRQSALLLRLVLAKSAAHEREPSTPRELCPPIEMVGASARPDRRIVGELLCRFQRLVGAIPGRDKAERMTCRIGVDSRAIGPRLIVELRPAQGEHGSLGCVEVVDPKMEVKLHGRRRIRPSRRLMARRSLERQVEACLLALAYRVPVCPRVDHRPPRELAVELCECGGITALQSDSAQLSKTAHILQPTRRPGHRAARR